MGQYNRAILVSLNELNFEKIEKYLTGDKLKTLSQIKNNLSTTVSETNYNSLEPWIQWTSFYYGLEAENHKIKKLGEIFEGNQENIFEELENKGFNVGAISPMNLKNNLKNPSFFIPDPWVETNSDNDYWSKLIHKSILLFQHNSL